MYTIIKNMQIAFKSLCHYINIHKIYLKHMFSKAVISQLDS
jgi:hypothetical protein